MGATVARSSPARHQQYLEPARTRLDLLAFVSGAPALAEADADGVGVQGAAVAGGEVPPVAVVHRGIVDAQTVVGRYASRGVCR